MLRHLWISLLLRACTTLMILLLPFVCINTTCRCYGFYVSLFPWSTCYCQLYYEVSISILQTVGMYVIFVLSSPILELQPQLHISYMTTDSTVSSSTNLIGQIVYDILLHFGWCYGRDRDILVEVIEWITWGNDYSVPKATRFFVNPSVRLRWNFIIEVYGRTSLSLGDRGF